MPIQKIFTTRCSPEWENDLGEFRNSGVQKLRQQPEFTSKGSMIVVVVMSELLQLLNSSNSKKMSECETPII